MKKGFLLVEPSKKSGGWGSGNSPGLLRDPRSKSPTWGSSSPVVHTANNNSSSSWGSAVPREKISWGSDQPSSAPSEPSPSISNTFQGQGFLPSKTMGVPCVVLTNWFTKKPHCIQISKKQFVTWHDDGRPHLRRFTAVFVCPVTGEVFPSGRYGDDPSVYELRRDEATGADVIWFKNKSLAKHGAAARAHDCLSLRRAAETLQNPVRISHEEPYLAADAPPLPTLPSEVQSKVEELKSSAGERMQVELGGELEEEEAQRYREQYRTERTGHNSNDAVDAMEV